MRDFEISCILEYSMCCLGFSRCAGVRFLNGVEGLSLSFAASALSVLIQWEEFGMF